LIGLHDLVRRIGVDLGVTAENSLANDDGDDQQRSDGQPDGNPGVAIDRIGEAC
jgi:hypothetical protein